MTESTPEGTHDPAVAAALAKVARLADEAEALSSQAGTDLVPVAADHIPAEVVKEQMIAVRTAVNEKARELVAAQKEARDAIEAMRRRADAELHRMTAALEPLQKQVARMQEGIWTMNLYLGTGEQLTRLREGEPAPADTPIVVRQTVLAADEETAIAAEEGGIDFKTIGDFDAWLVESDAHLDQVIPERRGVVAVMPRRADRDYGDPWLNAQNNQANHRTFFVIRNGENVWVLEVDFSVGPRLVPGRDEFTGFFQQRRHDWATGNDEYVPIEPGTREWAKAEEAAGARERHYMRVALILQGLIDRTSVFHPLPQQGLSLLHPAAYNSGQIVLLADDEHTLTTGRPSFFDWLRERNAQLRVGMRVVGNFRGQAFKEADQVYSYGGSSDYGRHARLRPERVESLPQTGAIHLIEKAEGKGLVFYFKRTDKVYRTGVEVPDKPGYVYTAPQPVEPSRRASCYIERDDTFILSPDLVTIEECEHYLTSRTERHAYVEMFPVLKAVIAAKRAEAEAEQPMRALLAGEIVRVHGVDLDEAEAALDDLISWWKTANRWHRPLVFAEDPQAERRAVRNIVREFGSRRDARQDADEAQVAARLRQEHAGLIVVARKRDGSWLAYEPMPRAHEGLPTLVYLREHSWTSTLQRHGVRDWVMPTLTSIARWRIVWAGSAWGARKHDVTPGQYLTDPEYADLIERAMGAARHIAAAPRRRYDHTAAKWVTARPPLAGRPLAVSEAMDPDSAEVRLTVWWIEDDFEPDPNYLSVLTYRCTWKRSTGGRVEIVEPDRTGFSSQTWNHDEKLPWEITYRTHDPAPVVFWSDPEAIEALRERQRKHRERKDRDRYLQRLAEAAWDSLDAQWLTAAWRAERERFVALYGDDETLWQEFQAKSPIGRSLLSRWDRDRVRDWLHALVRQGINLDGLTLREAASMADGKVFLPEQVADYRIRLPKDEDGSP